MARKGTEPVRLTLTELWAAWQALDGIWETEMGAAEKSARDKLVDAYKKLKDKDDGSNRFT